MYNNAGKLSLETDSNRDIQFGDSGTPAVMYVDTSTERIGLRTTSPDSTLHVSSSDSTKVQIEGNNGSGLLKLVRGDTSKHFTISMEGADLRFTPGDTDNSQNILFGVNPSSQKIGSRVGIGEPEPSEELDVSGSGAFSSRLFVGTVLSGSATRVTLGKDNLNLGDCSSILGGTGNTINDGADCSFIGSGDTNKICASHTHAFIGGGHDNRVDGGNHSLVVGGIENCNDGGGCSVLVGGYSNYNNGGFASTIVGGYNITISGSNFGLNGTMRIDGALCESVYYGHASIICTVPWGQGFNLIAQLQISGFAGEKFQTGPPIVAV